MVNAILVGDQVIHYKHGKGVVKKLVSQGLAEVSFGKTSEYVELRNIRILDQEKRQAGGS